MLILPTYGRPEKLQRFFDCYKKTKASAKGLIVVDVEDEKLLDYVKLVIPDNWSFYFNHEKLSVGRIYNKIFRLFPNEPFYGAFSDDLVPETDYWDVKLIDAAGSNCVAWGDDGIRGDAVVGGCAIGGDLCREFGYIFLPTLKHFYSDDWLTEVCKRRGTLRYMPEVRVIHHHFSTGKSAYDATYARRDGSGDKENYEAWLATQPQKQHVIFVCVNAGNYLGRGVEYVNKLYSMVRKNTRLDSKFSFQVFTDVNNSQLANGFEDYHQSIEVRKLPGDLQGWWNKLYLFNKELFDENARIIFLDLDTVIVGSIDHLFYYAGEFATLRDFWRPQGLGPAVILWRNGGRANAIWDIFEQLGRPLDGNGDQTFIERMDLQPDILQKLYPRHFVSYKTHARIDVPQDAKVVCFHGEPRPHEVDGWVKEKWIM